MKKFLSGLFCFLSIFVNLYSQSYKINSISYNIEGMMNIKQLERNVPVEYDKVFSSHEEFEKYIESLKQDYTNKRYFEYFTLDYSILENPDTETEETVYLADLILTAKNGFHFLAVPYFKYSTSSGLAIKLKAKDTNFFGTTNTFTGSIDLNIIPKDEYSDIFDNPEFQPMVNIAYNFPFKIGKVNMTWLNDYSVSYTIGDSTPEWDLQTGFSAEYEINDTVSVYGSFTQGANKDFDYDSYDDAVYFTEKASFSTPLNIFEIPDFSPITLEPAVSFTYNWDNNGINSKNTDLLSPSLSFDLNSGLEKTDWIGNFKRGISVSLTGTVGYNFAKETEFYGGSLNAKGYKNLKHLAFYSNLDFFAYKNTTKRFDSYLRGVRDNQHFADLEDYACESPFALVLNLDMPVKLFSTDWENCPITRKIGFMKYFNFELQVSPFIDLALCENTITNRIFDLRDGFYAGGLEVLVFPRKWPSFQIRMSLGFDLGTTLLKDYIDTSWRDGNISPYEISIGLGLHY